MKRKKIYIIANWKMNPPTFKKARDLYQEIYGNLPRLREINLVFCPPFVWLSRLVLEKASKNIFWGAQNIFWEKEKGAFTGEISGAMIKDIGCKYVILGHSERRKYLLESDEIVNKKIKTALSLKINPILCIGEEKRELNEFNKAVLPVKILEKQIKTALNGISKKRVGSLLIAYEPRWAIGTGISDTFQDVFEVSLFIKRVLVQIYSKNVGEKIPILYGGSVNSKNAQDFIEKGAVDGLLIGRTSLNAKEFLKLIKSLI